MAAKAGRCGSGSSSRHRRPMPSPLSMRRSRSSARRRGASAEDDLVAHDAALTERIRSVLADRPDVEEKRMVGGLSFVVGGHLCVGVSGDSLLVRVGPDRYEDALRDQHVRPLELGRKRPLGYVLVDAAGVRYDADLEAWIVRGLAFVTGLPPPRARTTG